MTRRRTTRDFYAGSTRWDLPGAQIASLRNLDLYLAPHAVEAAIVRCECPSVGFGECVGAEEGDPGVERVGAWEAEIDGLFSA